MSPPAEARATRETARATKRSRPSRARCRSKCPETATAASSRSSSRNTRPHFDGFDEKIISMYARGMTVREIQGHLQELYGVEVSPDLISRVTSAVIEEVCLAKIP